MRRISESDLVLPTLRALHKNKNGLSTADLQSILRKKLKPRGDDLILLVGRNDDRFSQIVRNLRAHRRLERDDLATYENSRYRLAVAGKSLLKKFSGVDISYQNQGFSEPAKEEALRPNSPLAFVEEGEQTLVTKKVRKRSKRLRDFAFKHFSLGNGTIRCEACNLEATEKYGDKAKGLIEIHHKKPIALSSSKQIQLEAAMGDLSPLCPTCHRLVHKNRNVLMSIEELKELVGVNLRT